MTFSPGLIGAGQRSNRVETLKSEIARIRQTAGGMILFASIAFLCVINILAILGPGLGWGIGIVLIVCVFVFLRAKIRSQRYQTEMGIFLVLFLCLVLWGWFGYEWVESWWMPPCHLGFWIETILVVFHLVVIWSLGWGAWGFWGELVDPNGPTAPRKATARETLIKPWDQETYGGRYLEEAPEPVAPARETIAVEVHDGSPESPDISYVKDLPALPSFRQFCAHVVQGHCTFAEANARKYNVPLDDVKTDQGVTLMMGFRTFRDFALDPARKWIKWKNPEVHARGVILSDKFLKILAAIGGVTVSTQATPQEQGD